jgi:two-component system LytT family response regulator
MGKIRVVIIDDESPARRKIRRFLASDPDFEVVAEAATGLEAVDQIYAEKPDLIFLDIQMPGLGGFAVVEALDGKTMPHIVFTTAFDQFALKAFEVQALDYLLKPFEQSRFNRVLAHVKQLLAGPAPDLINERVTRLLEEVKPRRRYVERILVHADERAHLLAVEKIDWVESAKNYVGLHVGKESYLLRGTIEGFYERLDPAKFIRANRSHLVNIESIKELQPWFHGEYKIILKDGKAISWSRRFMDKHSDFFLNGRKGEREKG